MLGGSDRNGEIGSVREVDVKRCFMVFGIKSKSSVCSSEGIDHGSGRN